MTVYDYLAKHNPRGAQTILNKYGYDHSPNWEQNGAWLKKVYNKHGDQVLKDIAAQHPDFGLITQHYSAPAIESPQKLTLNCDGGCGCDKETANCSGCDTCACNKNKNLNATGAATTTDDKPSPARPNTDIKPATNSHFNFAVSRESLLVISAIGVMAYIIYKSN